MAEEPDPRSVVGLPSCRFSSGPLHAVTAYPVSPAPYYPSFHATMGSQSPHPADAAEPNHQRQRTRTKSGNKSTYKHVPHREKAPHLVARRNARERRRVEAVNSAFVRLRKHVPHENRNKRISKVKTLRLAIEYIGYLQRLLSDPDTRRATNHPSGHPGRLADLRRQQLPHPGHQGILLQNTPPARSSAMEMSTKENQWLPLNVPSGLAELYSGAYTQFHQG